jgi:tetratricopeptide (TPR) repeat protein
VPVVLLVRALGYALYVLPLPIALWSPLAGLAEWRLWMVLPFFAAFAALVWLALLRTFYRPARRWSPYPTTLVTTLVLWPFAGLVAEWVNAGGWSQALLVVAAVLAGLRGLVEIPVSLVVLSAYAVADPLTFTTLAAPAAAAGVLWLAGIAVLDKVDTRARTLLGAGRQRQGLAWALVPVLALPLSGRATRAQIAELLATAMWFTGRGRRAVRYQRHGVRLRRRGQDVDALVVALRNLVVFEHTDWQHPAARRTITEARTLMAEAFPGYLARAGGRSPADVTLEVRRYLAEFVVEEVEMDVESGDISAADRRIDEALEEFGVTADEWPPYASYSQSIQKSFHQLMLVKADIAGAYLHDESRAERIYRRMIEVVETFDGPAFSAERRGVTVVRLAAVLTRQGRYGEAEEVLRGGLADMAAASVTGMSEPVLANLANLARVQGHYDEAEPLYRELVAKLGSRPDPGLAIMLRSGLADVLAAQGNLAEAREPATTAVRDAEASGSEMARRSSLLVLGRIHERAGDDEAAVDAYRRVMTIVESTRNRITTPDMRVGYVGGERRLESYERLVSVHLRLGRLGAAFDCVERARARALLDRTASAAAGEWAEPLDHHRIREFLAEAGRPVVLIEYTICDGELVAFGLRGDADVEVRHLPVDVVELRRFAETNFGAAGRVRAMTASGLDELWHGFDALVAPVAEWSRPGDLIVFLPHGVLNYLPLHALRCDGDYVIARNPIGYAPSASVLVRSRQGRVAADGPAAVFGDPNADLVFARAEAEAVAALFGTVPVLGADATAGAFARRAGGAAIVHYAGHASFDEVDAGESSLHLADGLLPARGIQELTGMGARVVTLSGCETGISRRHPGEELIGLTRAFLYAGAATVIAGLWRVADESTTALMERFYRELVRGVPAVDALRTAMLAIMAEPGRRAIYHWAPFILVGEWE